MREAASWDAPYNIAGNQLAAAGFEYRSYGCFSLMRLPDGVYTYGFLSIVLPTDRLQGKLIDLYRTIKAEWP